MQKLIVLFIVLILSFIPATSSAAKQSAASPANLLPDNTGFYVELAGQNLPADIDNLTSFFALEGFSDDIFAESDFAAWIGERVGVGIFPTVTLIFQVRDEAAADEFLVEIVGEGWKGEATSRYSLWKNHRSLTGDAILRTEGYLVMGDGWAVEAVADVLDSEKNALSQTNDFQHVKNAFSGNPNAWIYSKLGGAAVYTGDIFSVEAVLFGDSPDELPDAISTSALEGVPQDAFAVFAGTDLNIPLSQLGEIPQFLLDALATLTDTPQIAALFDSFFRTTLGIDYEREFLPLFDGDYAGFLTFGFGSVDDTLGLPVDGGLVLAAEDSTDAVFTAATVITRLQELDLPIERVSSTLFKYETGDILSGLDFYFGFTQGRLHISTESGTTDIQNTLDGRNITDNSVWQRTFEYAPEGTQFALYMNLQTTAAFLNAGQATVPEILQTALADVAEYVRDYESLALFSRVDADGTRTFKLVLLPD